MDTGYEEQKSEILTTTKLFAHKLFIRNKLQPLPFSVDAERGNKTQHDAIHSLASFSVFYFVPPEWLHKFSNRNILILSGYSVYVNKLLELSVLQTLLFCFAPLHIFFQGAFDSIVSMKMLKMNN